MPYLNFYDMEVYKDCREFRKRVSSLVREHFPTFEKFLLTSQLLRASRSITANLAEGHGRYSYKENIRYCRIARGSLAEAFEHLICAFDESYLDAATLEEMKDHYLRCNRRLNAYVVYLKKKHEMND